MLKIVDLLFLVRPPLLCASSTFFFAGAVAALHSRGEIGLYRLTPEILPNLGLFALVVSAAFIINQIFDVESDRRNWKSFLLSSGVVSRKEASIALAAVCVCAVGLSLVRDDGVRYMVWAGLALGIAYSAPPLRLKGRPILDMVANVFGFGVIGFAMGWLVYGEIGAALWVKCVPYALAMCGIFLNTCIPDEEGDRMAGDRTSCVAFGTEAVGRSIPVFMLAAGVAGMLTGEIICTLAVIGSLPAMVAVGLGPGVRNSVVASQFAARLLLVLVCIVVPLLAMLGIATYFGSRVYYRKRFRLRYPDLRGATRIPDPSL
jgi:4-hydroxybenzoate polyprenyltransferase